ncbi:MAG: hypothetical protein K0Q56_2581 [Sporolactobacillus laevolacticus]|jgi:hypothetical protein|nr:hypothetical protein [Sporolactobacillus laevolacticus]
MGKNFKKGTLGIVFASVIAVAGIISFHYTSQKQAHEEPNERLAVSNLNKTTEQLDKLKSRSFLVINKKTYTNKEFSRFRQARNFIRQANGQKPYSAEQLKQEFIKDQVILDEAKKEGLEATFHQAMKYADQVRTQFEANASQKVKDAINAYIKSLGISTDVYWKEYAVPAYQHLLTQTNLKEKFLSQKKFDGTSDSYKQEEWNKYQTSLVNKADVTDVEK